MAITTLATTFLYDCRFYRKSVVHESHKGENIHAIAVILKKYFPLIISTIFPQMLILIQRLSICIHPLGGGYRWKGAPKAALWLSVLFAQGFP